ncbi:hypothetical protein D9M72_499470 [compost metagenome]
MREILNDGPRQERRKTARFAAAGSTPAGRKGDSARHKSSTGKGEAPRGPATPRLYVLVLLVNLIQIITRSSQHRATVCGSATLHNSRRQHRAHDPARPAKTQDRSLRTGSNSCCFPLQSHRPDAACASAWPACCSPPRRPPPTPRFPTPAGRCATSKAPRPPSRRGPRGRRWTIPPRRPPRRRRPASRPAPG